VCWDQGKALGSEADRVMGSGMSGVRKDAEHFWLSFVCGGQQYNEI